MHILVSNDDGILAPGIGLLAEACRSVGHVTVVAPDREQSAASHALTLNRPLRLLQIETDEWIVDGTPADRAGKNRKSLAARRHNQHPDRPGGHRVGRLSRQLCRV